MVFNSVDFLVFFPVVLLVYFVVPKKTRYIWLLIASYYFYMNQNPKYAVLIGISTVITYLGGLILGRSDESRTEKKIKIQRKLIVAVCFVVNLSILFFFKYSDFILPIAISFYTFQALGYTVDVYRKETLPERNLLKYALFVSFFPVLLAGPIERSKNLLKQVQQVHGFKLWNYERITSGAALMLWGYFMKMVIADRLAVVVDYVFGNYASFGGTVLFVGAVSYGLQIYCDFASYSLLASGTARMMGFTLVENFNTPYFSKSIKEFWRRWHISLSSWFKDYLYIPLGGNRKGTLRKYVNLFVTFLVSGIWHGSGFQFVVWGGLHGLYQIVGDITLPLRSRCAASWKIKTDSFSHKLLQGVITFALVDFAWIFFRSNSLYDGCAYVKQMIMNPDPWIWLNGALYTLGLSRLELGILISALVMLVFVDVIRYRKGMQFYEYLNTQSLWFRWGIYILLVAAIYLFGMYGPGYNAAEFIYFQF